MIKSKFDILITGHDSGRWYVDLKTPPGSCGTGIPKFKPDATLKMKDENFHKLLAGQLSTTEAFVTGKLILRGSLKKALKLEKLLDQLRRDGLLQ